MISQKFWKGGSNKMNYFSTNKREMTATITINHPPANAISSDILNELSIILDKMEQDDEIRAIMIRGEGRFFSAGADIKEFTSMKTTEEVLSFTKQGQQLYNRIEAFPKPIIAVIHGAALGGGLELAMACHFRLVSEEAKLGLPELQLGLIPGFAGTQRLPRFVGTGLAAEMLFTSKPITGKEAVGAGLANHAYPEAELFDQANELLTTISKKSPMSLKYAIELLNNTKGDNFLQGVDKEAELFTKVFSSEDGKEGIQAFIEKRKPVFKGK